MWVVLIVIGLGSAVIAGLSGRLVVSLARRPRGGEAASTTMEFTLAFPVFLISVLVTIQTALMMHAQVVVDYAAFAAARSASVWIGSLDKPEVTLTADTVKGDAQERVLRAAVLGSVPISPKLAQLSILGFANPLAGVSLQLDRALTSATANLPANAQAIATLTLDTVERWPYASEYTTVILTAARQGCDDEPLKVTVEHWFRMAVPFAGRTLSRTLGGSRLLHGLGDPYLALRASHAMRRWSCQNEA